MTNESVEGSTGSWPDEFRHLGSGSQCLEFIDKLAHRRFNSDALAEEAATFVLEQLAVDDWDRLKRCEKKSNPRSWIITIVKNLLEDYSRRLHGRHRPPAWIKGKGKLWVDLWKAVCLERFPVPAVLHRYESRKDVQLDVVRTAISQIRGREPNCGRKTFEAISVGDIATIESRAGDLESREESGFTSESPFLDEEVASGTQRSELEKQAFSEQARAEGMILLMVKSVLDPEGCSKILSPGSIRDAGKVGEDNVALFANLRCSLELTDVEIVLLRMIYFDGFTLSRAASALNLSRSNAVYTRDKCLERIRKAVSDRGLELESLLHGI